MRIPSNKPVRLRMKIKAVEQRYKHRMNAWDKFVFLHIARKTFIVSFSNK